MLYAIFSFIGLIIVIALALFVGTVILAVGAALLFIFALVRLVGSINMRATPMICPNCGGNTIKIRSVRTGTTSNTYRSGGMLGVGKYRFRRYYGGSNRTYNSVWHYKREAVCQTCGFNYDFITTEDVARERNEAFSMLFISLIAIGVLLYFGFKDDFIGTSNNRSDEATKVVHQSESVEGSWEMSSDESDTVWAMSTTPLSDFDYEINDGELYLTRYKGISKKVRIGSYYCVDGKDYKVISVGGAFHSSSITSAIIPEGVERFETYCFNGADVEYLFIPSTLIPGEYFSSFWSYFNDIKKFYFGGTKERWIEIGAADYFSIKDKPVEYEVDPNTLGVDEERVSEVFTESESVSYTDISDSTAEDSEADGIEKYYLASTELNIRSSPDASDNSNIVGKIPGNGIAVGDTSEAPSGTWVKVTYIDTEGRTVSGWINSKYAPECDRDGAINN